MQKLDKTTIIPDAGEIMTIKDAFGLDVGQGGTEKRVFGRNGYRKDNPKEICFLVRTPGHTETEMAFGADSLMTNIMGGARDLILATHPWAMRDDEGGIIACTDYGVKGKSKNGSLKFFVSGDGKDPAGQRFTSKYVIEDGERVMAQVPVESGTWLKPNTDYYLTYRRTQESSFGQPPLVLRVVFTDDPANGGEVKIDLTDVEGEFTAIEMDLGPLGPGVFIPD